MDKAAKYYGLDLSLTTVSESINLLRGIYKKTPCFGLWGTFEDGFEWAKSIPGPRVFLSLGSIYGNDRFDRAVRYLKMCAHMLRPEDLLLIGIDCHHDSKGVWKSYHDTEGVFEHFIRNGFKNSNIIIGGEWYRDEDWELHGVLEQNPLQHRFLLRATRPVEYGPAGLYFDAGTEIECYEGIKQTPEIMRKQFFSAGLTILEGWESPSGNICKTDSAILFHIGEDTNIYPDYMAIRTNLYQMNILLLQPRGLLANDDVLCSVETLPIQMSLAYSSNICGTNHQY